MLKMKQVYEHFQTKSTSKTSFHFTRKSHPASGKLLCADYGLQHCQFEKNRSLLQSCLQDLPTSADKWLDNNLRRSAMMLWLIIHDVPLTDDQ